MSCDAFFIFLIDTFLFFSVTLQTIKFLGKQIKFKMKRSFKDYALLALKGMGMGAADVVPGVSGGTIAFIVGIYDELIDSIKSINAQSLKMFQNCLTMLHTTVPTI